ncbi:MAG: hypothetical protein CVU56_03895 [Deltaproteobacteria bacterium HGW-Deltaproteobacteria-14]|jgi:tRNA1(Val) A37 N6-methylase TrmN6|nr:MAG: hypothetical protein CVU56_03895 [Deltaproteobacteria bacterium HGW-Deltaproteobacteria-14]
MDDDPLERVQLTRRYHLHQRARGHRTATDDVLCAWGGVTAHPAARRYLDLGAGHGSVTLMTLGTLPADARAHAVEAQAISHALLTRNLAESDLARRATAVLGDIRDPELLGDARFDLITGSPPFMPLGSGPLPKDPQRAGGRFELRGGIEAYATAAARWLETDGVASLLMDGASRPRCERAFAAAGLALVGATTVLPTPDKPPRYIIYAVARATATAADERVLVVRDRAGAWTDAFSRVREMLDLP